jgi:hypothetical protein
MARKPKTPSMADWQPLASAPSLSHVLNDTELLKFWMELAARHPHPVESQKALKIALAIVDAWQRGPKEAKRARAEASKKEILDAEAEWHELRKAGSKQTFAQFYEAKFNTKHVPSDSKRYRARVWARSRQT